jgi:hypothetical protein
MVTICYARRKAGPCALGPSSRSFISHEAAIRLRLAQATVHKGRRPQVQRPVDNQRTLSFGEQADAIACYLQRQNMAPVVPDRGCDAAGGAFFY